MNHTLKNVLLTIQFMLLLRYSTGGYDTDEMVPTVEVYDPRMSVWVMAEPMHFSRGYASTAVLGGSIYAIGGVDNCDNILDIVCAALLVFNPS